MLSSSVWRGRSQSWFVAGLLLGGVVTAALIAAVGSLVLRPWLPDLAVGGLVVAVAAVMLLREFGLLRLPLPQNARQVPQRVTQSGPRFGALQFGFEMGTGMRTYMTSSCPYLVLVAIALVADVPAFVCAGLSFGIGRALMTTTRNASADSAQWDAELSERDQRIRRTLAGVSAALVIAVSALTALGTTF